MRSRLYTQEGLLYKSMWCPKPACGSPMDPHYHQGEHKMRCSKRKCRKITPVLVSVYFHTKGIPHIATRPHVRCVHTPPAVHLCTVIVLHIRSCASQCITVRQATKRVVPLHIAPRRRSPCASHGGPPHTALVCVLTARHHVYVHHGTTSVLPHIHIYSRHPPPCMCAIQCHMRIVARWHTPPQDQPVPGTRTCQGP